MRDHASNKAARQQTFWVAVEDLSGRTIVCSSPVSSEASQFVIEPATLSHGVHRVLFRWQDEAGSWSALAQATLLVADPSWDSALWIGDGREYRTEVGVLRERGEGEGRGTIREGV